MFRRMIVPLDGSAFAEQALPLALHLAKAQHGSLVLFQVIHAPIRSGGRLDPPMLVLALADSRRQRALHYLAGVRDTLTSSGVPIDIAAAEGPVPETILDAVALYEADSVVLASHGQTGPLRTVFGSVARQVVRHATCGVLVVHHPPVLPANAEDLGQIREPVKVALLLNDVNDLEQIIEPAELVRRSMQAQFQVLVLNHQRAQAPVGDTESMNPAHLAEIEQCLYRLGVATTTTITSRTSVREALEPMLSTEGRLACLVMVSHPLLSEADVAATAVHGASSDATTAVFRHLPNTMLFIPARSPHA